MAVLKQENNQPSLLSIRDLLLRCSKHFDLNRSLSFSEKIRELFPKGDSAQVPIDQFLKKKRHAEQLEKWKVPVFLLVTLLICLLIYFSARP
jgi:hypothetical protein